MNTSVIIRLQRLPLEATSADVRQFFRGLNIPDGGVHIIGGRDGDAFIGFASDEDARQAMRRDGEKIKDTRVKLFLSSRIEMQQVIDKTRTEIQQSQNQQSAYSNDGKRDSHSGRRRRSRSGDRHRRSRSRSPDRSRKSGGHQPRSDPVQPPPQTPTAPISGFSSFRTDPPIDTPSRYNQPARGVLDRDGPPPITVDNRILDRGPPPPKPTGYPPRGQGFASFPNDNGSAGFGGNHPIKPGMSGGNPRMPVNGGDAFSGPAQLIRPGGMVQPPFMSSGPQRFNDASSFAGPGPRGRMDTRFDITPDPRMPKPSPLQDTAPSFGVQQQPVPPPSRASRRALLPAPEESAEPTPDIPRNFDQPTPGMFPPTGLNPNLEFQQRPPHHLMSTRPNQPFVDQPMAGDWPMEKNVQQPGPGFPFAQSPAARPILLQAPRNDISLTIAMTAVPSSLLRYGAIREFFHPLDLEGSNRIKIAVDERGQRTGQVYCKFLSVDDAERALSYTGREGIYIRSCSDEEFEKAEDGGLFRRRSNSRDRESESGSYKSHREDTGSHSTGRDSGHGGETDFVLEVSNIPYKAVQRDLRYMFDRCDPLEIRRLYKHHHVNGKVVTSDTAFVIFDNERDIQAALRMRDRRLLDRELRVTRCSMATMEETFKRAPPPPQEAVDEWLIRSSKASTDRYRHHDRREDRSEHPRSRSPPRRVLSPQLPYQMPPAPFERQAVFKSDVRREPSPLVVSTPISASSHTCVCMKGVAMNATNRDVASFFGGLNIAPNGIRILKGTPSVAYVEFATPNDCEQALKKDRSYIGTQMVTVRPCSKEELMEAVHKQFGLNGNGGGGGNSPQMQPGTSGIATPNMAPPQAQPFFNGAESSTAQGPPFLGNPATDTLQPQGDFVPSTSQEELLYLQQLAALAKQQEEENNVGGKLLMDLNQVELTTGGTGSFSSPDLSDMPPIDPEVVCNIGVPGCVAALHNLPPRITLEEICQLFQGYQLIDDSVRMHYSNTGEPTGDCLLAFATARDAETAVANVNGATIGGQAIKMYVVPV